MPSALANATLVGADGQAITVSSLWSRRSALLMFLRHFGCVACSLQVATLLDRATELQVLGVDVVLVGSAAPSEIERFVREEIGDRAVTVLCDPSLDAYRAAGLHRSFLRTFGPRAALGYLRATARGFSRGGTRGDLLQQAGALLVDARGVVLWSHRSRALGDLAELSDMVDVLLPLAAARSGLGV